MIFKKLNLKFIFISIICLIVLIGLGFGFFCFVKKSKYNILPYEKVEFSNHKRYLEEQIKVLEILKKDDIASLIVTNPTPLNQQIVGCGHIYPSDIYIYKIDLNNDHILDVIAFVAAGRYGGTLGQSTIFYIVDKKGNLHEVFGDVTHGDIAIYKNKKGYRDIGIVHIFTDNNETAGISLVKWNGKEYQFFNAENKPLTKQYEEVFRHE